MIQVDGIFVQQGGGGINANLSNYTIYLENYTNYNVGATLLYFTVSFENGEYSITRSENSYYLHNGSGGETVSVSNLLDGFFLVSATNLSNGDNIYIRGDGYSSIPYPNDDESIGSTKTTPLFVIDSGAQIIISSE